MAGRGVRLIHPVASGAYKTATCRQLNEHNKQMNENNQMLSSQKNKSAQL
jgi:hypothetical protein